VQWVDLVEDLLAADPAVRAGLGGKAVRAYNFGVPGAGFPAFWSFYEKYGRAFDPDLIVVNYIESDFPRTNLSGALAHLSDRAEMVRLAASQVEKFLKRDRNFLPVRGAPCGRLRPDPAAKWRLGATIGHALGLEGRAQGALWQILRPFGSFRQVRVKRGQRAPLGAVLRQCRARGDS